MQYEIKNDTLYLIYATITYNSKIDVFDKNAEDDDFIEVLYVHNEDELSVTEQDLTNLGISFTTTIIDNRNISWLDGKTFTNDERLKGYIQKAIELGETEYYSWLIEQDTDSQRDILLAMLTTEVFNLREELEAK